MIFFTLKVWSVESGDNLITGDNGLGKSFLLDLIWYAMTRQWPSEANPQLANSFLMLAVISVITTAGALLLKNNLLMWFGASETIFPYANQYITIYLLGTIFALMAVGMNQFIICQGFAKVGMKSVTLGAIINIILDPVFIFVLEMGVRGAALATVLSQMASTSCTCPSGLNFRTGSTRREGTATSR